MIIIIYLSNHHPYNINMYKVHILKINSWELEIVTCMFYYTCLYTITFSKYLD